MWDLLLAFSVIKLHPSFYPTLPKLPYFFFLDFWEGKTVCFSYYNSCILGSHMLERRRPTNEKAPRHIFLSKRYFPFRKEIWILGKQDWKWSWVLMNPFMNILFDCILKTIWRAVVSEIFFYFFREKKKISATSLIPFESYGNPTHNFFFREKNAAGLLVATSILIRKHLCEFHFI